MLLKHTKSSINCFRFVYVIYFLFDFIGWVNTLVGGQKEGARGFMFFIINVDLTEEGLCKWNTVCIPCYSWSDGFVFVFQETNGVYSLKANLL